MYGSKIINKLLKKYKKRHVTIKSYKLDSLYKQIIKENQLKVKNK